MAALRKAEEAQGNSGHALVEAQGIVDVYEGLSVGISEAFSRCTDLKDALDIALTQKQTGASEGSNGVLSNMRARFASVFPALTSLQEQLQGAVETLVPFLRMAETLDRGFQELELQRAACRADRAQLDELERDLARRQSASGKATASLEEKEREVGQMLGRMQLAEARATEGQEQLTLRKEEMEQLREEMMALRAENDAMKEDARKFIKQSDRIERQARQEVEQLRRVMKELEEECEHYKDLLGNEQQRSKDIQKDFRRKLQRATSATADTSLNDHGFTTVRTLSASHSGRGRPIRELSEVVRQNEVLAVECIALRGEVGKLAQENAALVTSLKSAQDDARLARSQLGTVAQSRSELQKRLERQTGETKRAERTMTSLISSTSRAWREQREAEEEEKWESIQPIDSRPTERMAQPLRHPTRHRSIHVENW